MDHRVGEIDKTGGKCFQQSFCKLEPEFGIRATDPLKKIKGKEKGLRLLQGNKVRCPPAPSETAYFPERFSGQNDIDDPGNPAHGYLNPQTSRNQHAHPLFGLAAAVNILALAKGDFR